MKMKTVEREEAVTHKRKREVWVAGPVLLIVVVTEVAAI